MKRFLGVLAGSVGALVAIAVALAHAEPAQVDPGLGANLIEPPTQVEIVMTQEMFDREGANDIDVFDAQGIEVTAIAAVVDRGNRNRISVPLPTNLAPGQYTVKWKTLSADDGDSEDGEYVFTYDPSKPSDPGRTTLSEAPVTPGGEGSPTPPPARSVVDGGDEGMSWILVAAVGVAGLAIGSGATFLLVQRRV
jgi:methionine-rich copper-binding protein CopC